MWLVVSRLFLVVSEMWKDVAGCIPAQSQREEQPSSPLPKMAPLAHWRECLVALNTKIAGRHSAST